MRAFVTGVALAALAACGSGNRQAVSLTAPTTGPLPATQECVRQELDELGYRVTMTGQPMTVITGLRTNEPAWWLQVLGYRPTVDQISVSVDGSRMEIVAVSSETEEAIGSQSLASENARANAERVLRECSAR